MARAFEHLSLDGLEFGAGRNETVLLPWRVERGRWEWGMKGCAGVVVVWREREGVG